jgi:DNA-binding MltR family transcriptional regulator
MTTRQLDDLVDEILDEKNDRALIILCSSIIDIQLLNILDAFFLNSIKKDDDLLKGDNPLATFSSRIKIVYRLGLVDETFRALLDTIRKVRNLSAHSIELDIRKSPIRDHILTLKRNIKDRPSYKLITKRYFENNINKNNETKALFVTISIILEAVLQSIKEVKQNDKSIKISLQ